MTMDDMIVLCPAGRHDMTMDDMIVLGPAGVFD
jgi:hypothetical protein